MLVSVSSYSCYQCCPCYWTSTPDAAVMLSMSHRPVGNESASLYTMGPVERIPAQQLSATMLLVLGTPYAVGTHCTWCIMSATKVLLANVTTPDVPTDLVCWTTSATSAQVPHHPCYPYITRDDTSTPPKGRTRGYLSHSC